MSLAKVVLLIGSFASTIPSALGQPPSVRLERAIHTEEIAGDLNQATKLYADIIKDGEGNRALLAQARFRLAMCRQKQGHTAEAQKIFKELVKFYPEQSDLVREAEQHLGGARYPIDEAWRVFQQRKFSEAEARFRKVTEAMPREPEGWSGLGWSCFNQGKHAEAQDAWKRCLELAPHHPAALNGLGWAAQAAGNMDEAAIYWLKMDSIGANAMVYLLKGEYEAAARCYEQWLLIEPTSAEARDGLRLASEWAKNPKGKDNANPDSQGKQQ